MIEANQVGTTNYSFRLASLSCQLVRWCSPVTNTVFLIKVGYNIIQVLSRQDSDIFIGKKAYNACFIYHVTSVLITVSGKIPKPCTLDIFQ